MQEKTSRLEQFSRERHDRGQLAKQQIEQKIIWDVTS